MSNGYRAQWKIDSTREAEVHHFKKLKAAESFLHRVVDEANKWLDEKEAAVAAGVDPLVANFGSRATGLDASGKPLPETPAKPRKPRQETVLRIRRSGSELRAVRRSIRTD